MEKPIKNGGGNPYEKAGLLSTVLFGWQWPLMRKGAKEELSHGSMYEPISSEQTHKLWERLDRGWKKELKKKQNGGKPSFRLALARAYGCYYALVGIIIFMEDCCRLASPVCLKYLLGYFSDEPSVTQFEAYMYAMGIALSALFQSVLSPNIVFYLNRAGLQWRAGTAAMIYRKALKLSHGGFSATSTGHIIDLVSADAEKIEWNIWFLHFWRGIIHTVFTLTFTYYFIGPVVFISIGFVLLMILIQGMLGKLIAYYRRKGFKLMDKRVNTISEVIGGMRVIKMYCWEKTFADTVHAIRKKEIGLVWISKNLTAVMLELSSFNQRFLTAIIVVVYVFLDGSLSADKVFPMFTFFGLMCSSTLQNWPWAIKTWLETGVSIKRIENFLLLEEQHESVQPEHYVHNRDGSPSILISSLSASWSLDSPQLTLSDISCSVGKGEVLTVVGEVGSGKSSLLLSICGELPVSSGSIFCGGRIAYSAQQPWVFSASIRQNILFGSGFDEYIYQTVLDVCCLTEDLATLPCGDSTLVGDKGVTLSGGQKARVSLARAVYADADVYLLDDPLSAVDTHVGNQLFQNCIKSRLKNKAVILVTHQLQYLHQSDKILVLHKGKSISYGSYQDLIDSSIDFSRLLQHNDKDEESGGNLSSDDEKHEEDDLGKLVKQSIKNDKEERDEEDRAVGSVTLSVYWQYFRAGGNVCVLIFLILMNILTQAAYNGGDWWLSVWSESDAIYANSTHFPNGTYPCNKTQPWDCLTTNTNIYIYSGFLGLMLLLGLIRAWTLFGVAMGSSKALHQRMYNAVTRAPIRFHDTNPKGRIVNRFSSDVSSIDYPIPNILEQFVKTSLVVVGSITLMTIINPMIALPVLPLFAILVYVRKYYLFTQRQLQRLSSAARSPILTHLSATLDGIHTIRAFDKQDKVIKEAEEHYDAFTGTWFADFSAFCWFFVGISTSSGAYNAIITFACLLVDDYDLFNMTPSQVGLILSYVTSLMYITQSAVRLSSQLELQMIGAERIIRYSKLESEGDLKSPDKKPPDHWPSDGKIVFDHVSFAYAKQSPHVLKNINCEIKAKEKIGIAGRTGAGKSSLVQCLFRMAEPMGQIRIDDIPINDIGLHDIRSRLAVIPQDPFLFSGTIRENLDPFDGHTDEDLWQVLAEVQLKDTVSQQPEGLLYPVTEAGANFSVGQKQLFCLARAILCNAKILLLDEATANVDKKTDEMIQSTIRKKFADCTVLIVAHRLHTIMDCDRILVIDNGQIVEFDGPFTLLQNREGHFYQLTAQTGPAEQRRLYQMAEEAYISSKHITYIRPQPQMKIRSRKVTSPQMISHSPNKSPCFSNNMARSYHGNITTSEVFTFIPSSL